MRNVKGFTLVELLVVIAIISILAGIVAPKVGGWISRGRMARAVSEIHNADLALTKMLTDADRRSFAHCWVWHPGADPWNLSLNEAAEIYSKIFYELLRRGRDAEISDLGLDLRADVRKKLGTNYMEIGFDPWGQTYKFYAGPLPAVRCPVDIIPFRCYREPIDPALGSYIYDMGAYDYENSKMRGNPRPGDFGPFAPGFPAARDYPVYMFSCGEDGVMNQYDYFTPPDPGSPNYVEELRAASGYDDVNNWDNNSGWSAFY